MRLPRTDTMTLKRVSSVITAAAIVFAMTACGTKSNRGTLAITTPTPTTSVKNSVEAFRGKVVILDFWATWCPPCRAEIPDFVELQQKYQDDGLEIIGVSLDPMTPNRGGTPAVHSFVKQQKINYTILLAQDDSAIEGYDVTQGIPTTYVIDRGGRIVKTYVGMQSKHQFEQDIKRLL
ncbi:MAG TPA: TlpA disulfide reductase family protein [Blastocatellia bacterium]|nr:TlpA disulfide reductase family protein [Blastocatellia bacterium]